MGNIKICPTTPLQDQILESRDKLYPIALSWCGDKMLADDIVQETITAAIKNQSQLREESKMFGWICSIMRNNMYRQMRKQKKHESVDDQFPSNDLGPFGKCQEEDIVTRVRQAVASLPIEQRQIISLVDLGNLAYCDVAQVLDIPIGTVMSRLHRARKSLLKRMKQDSRPIMVHSKKNIHLFRQ
ncbi:MAG: RNA polymerase sigma factor [Anaerolineae bacterium]|nr:RNA polymerase sigma factor [Anaerolineae bacterium]